MSLLRKSQYFYLKMEHIPAFQALCFECIRVKNILLCFFNENNGVIY